MAPATLHRREQSTEARKEAKEHWLRAAGYYDPDFAQAIDTRLDELGRLEPNWDQYGAPPIDPAIIAAARAFIRSLPVNLASRPSVVPMSPGNLQFEWRLGSKILELEFQNNGTVRYLQWYPDHGIEEEDAFDATNTDKAVELVQWFMSERAYE